MNRIELLHMFLQFYPFGYLHNDTALPPFASGEGSSPPIPVSDGFYFYDEIVQTVYVSWLRMYVNLHQCKYLLL